MNERIKEIVFDCKEHFRLHNYEWKFKLIWVLPVFVLLLMIDIVTKQLAVHHLTINGPSQVFLKGIVEFSLVFNTGIAYGTNQDNLAVTIPIAVLVTLVALMLLFYLNGKFFVFGVMLVFTGGVGNLVDRVWNHGRVVDFIAWIAFPPNSVFNVSDAWVSIGIVIILIGIIKMLISEIINHFKP